jgi:hypothetical protein
LAKLRRPWDTVGDRLFKIRNCMNLDGIVRELPLLAPPIDPLLLVEAAERGIDLSTALNDMNTPMSQYRFCRIAAEADEFTNEVKALRAALLAALEKQDAEVIGNLPAQHESNLS